MSDISDICIFMHVTIKGNCLEQLKNIRSESVDLVFYSPPYWNLHKYGDDEGEIGFNQTYSEYLESMVQVTKECRRILKDNGNYVVNIMDLVRNNIPIMISNDFIHRFTNEAEMIFVERIVWHIKNKMPVASDKRFCNKMEWILHFSKTDAYYFDKDSVREPHSEYAAKDKRKWKWNSKGKCPGNNWNIPAYRVSGKNKNHVAGFPEALCDRVIKCWCPENGTVLDPFAGSGTTGISAVKNKRSCILIEKEQKYYDVIRKRFSELSAG